MHQCPAIDHVIYNKKFYPVMDEFKRLILEDKEIESYCTHNLGRFSAALRLLIIQYVKDKTTNPKVKDYLDMIKKGMKIR